MSLGSDMQQNIQTELNFSSTPAGEACEAGREETELLRRRMTRKPSQDESIDGGSM